MELSEAEGGSLRLKRKEEEEKKKNTRKVGVKSHRRETRRQKLPSALFIAAGGTNPIMSPLGVSQADARFNCCRIAVTPAPNYFEAHWSAQTVVAAAHDAGRRRPKLKKVDRVRVEAPFDWTVFQLDSILGRLW